MKTKDKVSTLKDWPDFPEYIPMIVGETFFMSGSEYVITGVYPLPNGHKEFTAEILRRKH